MSCSSSSGSSLSERGVWGEPCCSPQFPQLGAAPGSRGVLDCPSRPGENTRPEDVGVNQVYEFYSEGTALVPNELEHMHRVLTTMTAYLNTRAAYLNRSGLRPRIQRALMALPIESSKLFTGKVQEARLWDAEEDEVDQRKAFLKPSSSGYHKQQTSAKGKGPAAGKSSASTTQAKQTYPKPAPPPPPSKLRRILDPSSKEMASLVHRRI